MALGVFVCVAVCLAGIRAKGVIEKHLSRPSPLSAPAPALVGPLRNIKM